MHSQKNSHHTYSQHYARLFPELAPLKVSEQVLKKLSQMMCERGNANDSECTTNGVGIFGQFMAHDLTFDLSSSLSEFRPDYEFRNERSYCLDLDCVFGGRGQDYLYDKKDPPKLLLGECFEKNDCSWYDLPRNAQCTAIIPDPRNDENIIVARLHGLFMEFYNKVVDYVRAQDCPPEDVAAEAKRITIWHYQWLVLYEYIYKLVDWTVFQNILDNGSHFYTDTCFLPLEFTGAAFRLGHSQTREINHINDWTNKKLFDLGTFSVMDEFVDYHYLFDFNDGKVQYAKRIDTKIASSFFRLPFVNNHSDPFLKSLPFLNLKRGVAYRLSAGEAIAHRMGYEPIEVKASCLLNCRGTPLWYYILKEAEVLGHGGEHLGPVGSTLLGETFMTILKNDDHSFLKVHPKWKPFLGSTPGEFNFVDLVEFVGEKKMV